MSARFTKLKEVDLSLNDPVIEETELKYGDSAPEINPFFSDIESGRDDEREVVTLDLDSDASEPVFIPKWKFWSKPYRYNLTKAKRSMPRKSCVCKKSKCKMNSWRAVIIALLAFSAAVLVSIVVSRLAREPSDETPVPLEYNGAVAADVPVCSEMAADILKQNGSAVDATITALLCLGVVHAESSGLGGGGFMTVRHSNGSVYSINFREAAPSAATEDMFHSDSTLSKQGGLSVAVPGELKGMEKAHSVFGRLTWKKLFTPVIALCKNGFNMTLHAEKAVNHTWDSLSKNPQFRQIYLNSDGTLKKSGDIIIRPDLASTLELIANQGANVFYRGSIAESIVRAVNESNQSGILTMEDLSAYEALLEKPLHVQYNGHTVYVPPSPAGGPLLLFILNVMNTYDITAQAELNLTCHRLVEAFKYGFALRTQLGDPTCESCSELAQEVLTVQRNMTSSSYANTVKLSISDDHTYNVSHYHAHYSGVEDSGTTHLSVLAPDGQAVSVTSSVNTYFGSKVITDTGIVLNNEMDDFSSPNITNAYGLRPSPANYIGPGKRPLSSTAPTIVLTDVPGSTQSDPRLIIGASGGTRIPTAVAQAIIRHLSLSDSLSDAIEAMRIHHQLLPNQVCPENGFSASILEFLSSLGHVIDCESPDSYAAVQGVAVSHQGYVTAHSDSRKQSYAVVVD